MLMFPLYLIGLYFVGICDGNSEWKYEESFDGSQIFSVEDVVTENDAHEGSPHYREKKVGSGQGQGLQLSIMESLTTGSRRKRAVPANYTKLWDEKIPYVLHSTFRALGRKKKRILQRAMSYISDHMCVVFEDVTNYYRAGSTTWLSSRKYPDGNYLFIKHSGYSCRANIKLETSTGPQEVEPCDDFIVNLHELLHMLRGNHMHQGINRDRYITINMDNINPVLRRSYSVIETTSQLYFEPFSVLMYAPLTWSANLLETWTPIRDDIAESDVTRSTSPVEFWELNTMYKCAERFCTPRDCGPGYLARVKGACTCVCPREFDPLTNCTFHIERPKRNMTWPNAPFSLFSSSYVNTSCPEGFDPVRTVKFKTLWGGQDWQMKLGPEYYEMPWPWAHMPICTRARVAKRDWDSWPDGGDFCVIKPKRFSCRSDFSEFTVWVRGQSRATYTGNVGDFRFSGNDMTVKMCCRQSTLWNWPLELPNGQAFRLISGGSCPKVDGMREYQMILLLSSRMTPRQWGNGAKPWVNIFKDQIQIRTCYYQPPTYGCNMEISLDEVESHVTLVTPGYHSGKRQPNRRCFYNFIVPEGSKLKVTFNHVDIETQDKLYVRRFHKWQNPYPLDKHHYPHEMVSEGSYMALEWWSSYVYWGISNRGVNFTVSMISEEEIVSCYNATTGGSEYDGHHTYSETFEECLPWKDTIDCIDFPGQTVDALWLLQAGNKCRNPGGLLNQPWCYTYKNGTNCHKRYCDVCNYQVPTDVIKDCATLIASDPNFCNESISKFGCFQSCNMSQPVYSPGTCGRPLIPADGEVVGSATRETYKQGEHVLVKCSNPRDNVVSSMRCTAQGWSMLTHACSASYNETCPNGWAHHGSRCFKYFTYWVRRREAEDVCRSQSDSGTLFRVMNVPDQVMMRRFRFRLGDRSVYAHGMWISGERNLTDGKWYFTDSPLEMKYFNWTIAADSINENCIKMTDEYSWSHNAGAWTVLSCDDPRAIGPFVCQTDVPDAEVWDRSDMCEDVMLELPQFCTSAGTRELAALYCAESCRGNLGNDSRDCHPPDYLTNMVTGSRVVSPGQVMTFSCPQGQFRVGGDLVRTCGDNSSLHGEDLRCSATPSHIDVGRNSLRKRRDSIKKRLLYLLDNDAYRIPMRGNISKWFYYCKNDGRLHAAVFSKDSGNKYIFVGLNSFRCEAGYKMEYTVPPSQRISVEEGEVVAVMSPLKNTLNANLCDGAMNEIMINRVASAGSPSGVTVTTVFRNVTCMVPSLGYRIES